MFRTEILLLILCFFMLSSTASAQSLSLENNIRFLALGDSYTIGQGVPVSGRWPEQLADSLEQRGFTIDTLTIIATTGWRTDNLINAIRNNNLEDKDYNLVSLLIGVNNQFQNRPFSQYVTEFPGLLDSAIRYAGGDASHVFVVSIPDYAFTPFGQGLDPEEITMELDDYNAFNRQIAEEMGVTYFDITPISRQGLEYPQYVANDGLHPSAIQYTEWVKLMLETIDENLTSVSAPSASSFEISISPNPASSFISIAFTKATTVSAYHVDIFDINGRTMLSETTSDYKLELSIDDLPEGLYIMKVISGSKYAISKFLKG